jgi:hypothetical protein
LVTSRCTSACRRHAFALPHCTRHPCKVLLGVTAWMLVRVGRVGVWRECCVCVWWLGRRSCCWFVHFTLQSMTSTACQ